MAAALQWAPEIRVNAIAPGPVLPPTNIPDSKMEETLKKVPLGKAVNMRNLCSACLFLAENESITGQIIFADCGQHLL
jgi:NAD(P)-dependent dehydrogenase (short-subunit alcohol dehydrogenase family)